MCLKPLLEALLQLEQTLSVRFPCNAGHPDRNIQRVNVRHTRTLLRANLEEVVEVPGDHLQLAVAADENNCRRRVTIPECDQRTIWHAEEGHGLVRCSGQERIS